MNVLIAAWISVLVVIVPVALILFNKDSLYKWGETTFYPWAKKHLHK
jgi:hypothetical protein